MAVITYKCPNCGGGLKFDPKTQKYQCEFCLSSFTQEELKELKPQEGSQREVSGVEADYYEKPENDTLEGLKAGGKENPASEEEKGAAAASADSGKKAVGAAVVYTCPSCGANIVTEKNTAATFCYYCHSPIVLKGQLSGNYLPDKVLPFKFDKKAAEEKFLSYTGHKKFVPKAFSVKTRLKNSPASIIRSGSTTVKSMQSFPVMLTGSGRGRAGSGSSLRRMSIMWSGQERSVYRIFPEML